MKKTLLGMAGCTLLLLSSCSDDSSASASTYDSSASASTYDDSEVSFEKDKEHKDFVRLKSSGHYALLGTNDDQANKNERPAMKVKFDYDFSICEHEVTQEEFASIMGGEPEKGMEKRPIANVTYGDMVLYANARSKKEGFDTVYTYTDVTFDKNYHATELENLAFDPEEEGYRLPTEAEWIFVASHGWDVDSSWNAGNSQGHAHDVCTMGKNDLGICDMAGNLAEWVNDWSSPLRDTTVTNYVGVLNGSERVYKGGSFSHNEYRINMYSRTDTYTIFTSTYGEYVGARLAFGKIKNPVWLDANGSSSSTIIKSLAKASSIKNKLGTLRAKLAFVNEVTDQLVYINYNESSYMVREIQDPERKVRHPDISPDGEWVAFSTGEEGSPGKSELYVRRLNLPGSDLVRLDVESAAIPRWKVLPDGDTVIVYVTSTENNKDTESFMEGSTWQVPFSNGQFGKPKKLFNGSYHGGLSDDGKLAVTGARLLRARLDKKETVDTVWYDGAQACNVSLAQDGTKRTLFLDFADSVGMSFVGKNYDVHERLFIADSSGKLIQSVGSPSDGSFDHTEWVNGKNLAVASISNNVYGTHSRIVLVDFQDSSITDLAKGEELWHPCLRILDMNLPEEESYLDLDSAGAYMTSSSDITTRIMKVKMEFFWEYRNVTEVAIIGSSRSFSGVAPVEIKSHFAINYSYSLEDMTATNFFVKNYFIPLMPKLKAVMVTLDYDRWFITDGNWNLWFEDMPGYRYDENHSFWKDGVPEDMYKVTKTATSPSEDEYFLFAYNHGLYRSEDCTWGGENPEVDGDSLWYSKNPSAYQYNREKLVEIIEAAKEKGILVIGAVFPQSPYYVKKNVWGRYGLTLDDAKEIQEDMKSLEKKYSNFHIFDEYKDGINDYENEDFSNEDHLGLKGADKFAQRLDSLLVKLLDE